MCFLISLFPLNLWNKTKKILNGKGENTGSVIPSSLTSKVCSSFQTEVSQVCSISMIMTMISLSICSWQPFFVVQAPPSFPQKLKQNSVSSTIAKRPRSRHFVITSTCSSNHFMVTFSTIFQKPKRANWLNMVESCIATGQNAILAIYLNTHYYSASMQKTATAASDCEFISFSHMSLSCYPTSSKHKEIFYCDTGPT